MNCPNCHCPRGEPLTVAVNSLVTRCHHAFHAVATAEAPPLSEPLHPQSPVTPDDFAQQKPAQDAMACPTCNDAPGAAPFCSNGYHAALALCGTPKAHHAACPVWRGEACACGAVSGLGDASKDSRSCVHLFDQAVICGPCLVCGARPWVDRRDPDQPSTQPLGTVLVADSNPPERLGSFALIKPPYTTPVPTLHDGSTGWVYCEACDAPQPVAGHECLHVVGADGTRACAPGGACWFAGDLFNLSERAAFAESLLCAMAFDHAAFLGERLFCVRSRRDRVTHGLGCVFCDAARSA